jgi:hypothetical protein
MLGVLFVLEPTMRPALTLFLAVAAAAQAPERIDLHLLFVGETAHAGRAREFTTFLAERFASVAATTHERYTPAALADVDVVLLDWHQDGSKGRGPSPLGPFEEWHKPLVLLGSAGMDTAVAWNVFGGVG